MSAPPESHRAGFIALCGRPNVGKSTLLNALLGHELAVATALPQTTRERMLGVWTGPGFQAVLVDTPGIHRARSALNRFMVDEALAGASDVDAVCLLAEAPLLPDQARAEAWQPGAVALEALAAVRELGKPVILVLTKCDRVRKRDLLLPVLARWSQTHDFAAIVPVSARTGEGLDALRDEVVARLPESPPLYDPEDLSDRPVRWHVAELVRQEIFEQLRDELPYSCAVVVESYREGPRRDRIQAVIHVERDSQRAIVIGRGGRQIRALREGATRRVRDLVGRPVDLSLEVRVSKNWTKNPAALARLGYRKAGAR